MKLIMENWKRYLNEVSEINTHVVKEKENLTKIAKMYGVPLADLESANSEIEDTDLILVGQEINIPLGSKDTPDSAIPEEEETLDDIIFRVSEDVNGMIENTQATWYPALQELQKQYLLIKGVEQSKNPRQWKIAQGHRSSAFKSFYKLFYSHGSGIILQHAKKAISETLLTPREQARLEVHQDPRAWYSLLAGLAIIKLAVLTSPTGQPLLFKGAAAWAMGNKKDWFEEYDLINYAAADLFGPLRKSARDTARSHLNKKDPSTGETLYARLLSAPLD